MHPFNRLKTWWVNLTSTDSVERELAWRGSVLNSVVASLMIFVASFFVLNVIFWFLKLDDGGTAISAIFIFLSFVGLFLISKRKSISLAIKLFSLFCIALSFFLSFGWGVGDITVSAVYAAAIIMTSMLLRGRPLILVMIALLTGYLTISSIELSGWFDPPFYTELRANLLTATTFLSFLGFLGYTTANLIDRVLTAQIIEAERRQELESRIQIAAEVQLSMLPDGPPSHHKYDVAGQSIPARYVGGDFYNYHYLPDDELAVIIGDVTGKGIESALLMAVTTGVIDSLIPTATEPAELLAAVSSCLQKHSRRSGLNAACLASFLTKDGQVYAANAGCIEPVIRRADGRIEWLNIGGLPMGIVDDSNRYNQAHAKLNPGDMVIFITDGVVEVKNEAKKLLGFDYFESTVTSGPAHSSQAMKAHILDEVQAYQGLAEQHDDATVVVVRVRENND